VPLFQVANGNDTPSNRATGENILFLLPVQTISSDRHSRKKEVSHKINLSLRHWKSSKLMPESQK